VEGVNKACHTKADHGRRLGRPIYNLRQFAHVDGLKGNARDRRIFEAARISSVKNIVELDSAWTAC
jgi:hypothetical protein